jgi:hypothetical protein
MQFLVIEGGFRGGAILTMELPERGNVGNRNQMLFLGMEGGSRGGAILTMELPERGNVGKEPDAVPSLEWKEGPRVELFLPWNCLREGM